MEVSTKVSDKTRPRHGDTFLSDAVHGPARKRVGYADGFRFGIGFMLANLTLGLLVAAIAWGIIAALHIS